MGQCLLRGESLRWIEICESSNKIFEILVEVRSLPKRKRLSGLLLTETPLDDLEDLAPGAFVTQIPQQSIKPVLVREVRDLAFENNGQLVYALGQLGFVDGEDYDLGHGVDALREYWSVGLRCGGWRYLRRDRRRTCPMASRQVLVHALRGFATSSSPAERPWSLCLAEDALRPRDRQAVPAQYLSRLQFLSFESKHCLLSHLDLVSALPSSRPRRTVTVMNNVLLVECRKPT